MRIIEKCNRTLATAALSALLLSSLFFALSSQAHVPVHSPPPPPDWAGDAMRAPQGAVSVGGANGIGGAATGVNPRGPNSGPRGSAGSMTKKNRAVSIPINWEFWWARNRYQYLDFPDLAERVGDLFPLSPDSGEDALRRGALRSSRKICLKLFRPMLNHESARLRRASLIGLAMLDDQDSVGALLEGLKDNNQTVRDSAMLALGLIDHREARHTLLHMAQGTAAAGKVMEQSVIPDYFRGLAQVALAVARARGVESVLKSTLTDSKASPEIKALALEGFGIVGGENSAKTLIDFLDEGKAPPQVLAAATAAMGKTRQPLVLHSLEKLLNHRETFVRQSAALALGGLVAPGDDKFIQHLARTYRHSNDQALKGFSLLSIGMIGGNEAVRILDPIVMHGNAIDCSWACLGLGFALRDIQSDTLVSHLLNQARSHASRSTRGAAAIALGLAQCQEAVQPLLRMLKEGDDPWYRGYCALALGLIGNKEAIPGLKKALEEDPMPQVNTQAAMSLAMLDDLSTVPTLIEMLLSSENDTTKSFVALSLSYMGDPRVVNALSQTLEENKEDDLTLAHCVYLVAKLLSGRTAPYLDPLAAGSNFACEYPMVGYLLDYGI